MNIKPIGHIKTDFPEKFGVPRQSGLVGELSGTVILYKEYASPDAVKGLDGFDYIWLLWEFEGTDRKHFCATVKPPRLGGNTTAGVFATRSPFRPNPIGLSCVRLLGVETGTESGTKLFVAGVDMKDGTKIYDIKPYLPDTESHTGARGGFAHEKFDYCLQVDFPENLLFKYPEDKREAAVKLLMQDPRPSYHSDPRRLYGLSFAGMDIRFTVDGDLLTVRDVVCIGTGD